MSIEFKQKPLNSIGKRFSVASRALECLDVKKAKCFQAVVDSRRLVEWLRTTIKCKHTICHGLLAQLTFQLSHRSYSMENARVRFVFTSCLVLLENERLSATSKCVFLYTCEENSFPLALAQERQYTPSIVVSASSFCNS